MVFIKRNKDAYEAWKTMYPSCTYPYQTLVEYRLKKLAARVLTANNTTTRLARRRHCIPQTVYDHIGTLIT